MQCGKTERKTWKKWNFQQPMCRGKQSNATTIASGINYPPSCVHPTEPLESLSTTPKQTKATYKPGLSAVLIGKTGSLARSDTPAFSRGPGLWQQAYPEVSNPREHWLGLKADLPLDCISHLKDRTHQHTQVHLKFLPDIIFSAYFCTYFTSSRYCCRELLVTKKCGQKIETGVCNLHQNWSACLREQLK